MQICPVCGKEVNDRFKFCPFCRSRIAQAVKNDDSARNVQYPYPPQNNADFVEQPKLAPETPMARNLPDVAPNGTNDDKNGVRKNGRSKGLRAILIVLIVVVVAAACVLAIVVFRSKEKANDKENGAANITTQATTEPETTTDEKEPEPVDLFLAILNMELDSSGEEEKISDGQLSYSVGHPDYDENSGCIECKVVSEDAADGLTIYIDDNSKKVTSVSGSFKQIGLDNDASQEDIEKEFSAHLGYSRVEGDDCPEEYNEAAFVYKTGNGKSLIALFTDDGHFEISTCENDNDDADDTVDTYETTTESTELTTAGMNKRHRSE